MSSPELQLSRLLRKPSIKLTKALSLVERDGFRVNFLDEEGCTPMFLSTWCGQTTLVKKLHRMGASITAYNTKYGCTPLMAACMMGRDSVVEYIAPQLTLQQLTCTYRRSLSTIKLCDCDSRQTPEDAERCFTCACWNGKTALSMAEYERHDRCAYIVRREIDRRTKELQKEPEEPEVEIEKPKTPRQQAPPQPRDNSGGLRAELSQAHALIASLRAQLAAAQSDAQLARDSEANLRRQVKEKSDKLWDADELIRCLERKNGELAARVREQDGIIADLKSRNAVPADTSGLEAQLAGLQRQNELLLTENAKLRLTVADQTAELDKLRASFSEQSLKIDELNAQLAQREESLRQSLDSAKRLQDLVSELEAQVEELEAKIRELEAVRDRLEERLSVLSGSDDRIAELEKEIGILQSRCKDQKTQIDNFTAVIDTKEKRIRELESEVQNIKSQLQDRSMQVGKLAIQIQGQQEHIQQLEKELTSLEEQLERPCDQCAAEKRRADVLASLIADKDELFGQFVERSQFSEKNLRLIDDWKQACEWRKRARCFCEHSDGIKPDGSTQIYKCTYCRCFTCKSLDEHDPLEGELTSSRPRLRNPRSPRRRALPMRASASSTPSPRLYR